LDCGADDLMTKKRKRKKKKERFQLARATTGATI
jgi:hypothetical protein